MKTIATLQVDLDRSGIGTRSRLADDLDGTPVLCRTVDRVLACGRIQDVFILCPSLQVDKCKELVSATQVHVVGTQAGEAPWAGLVRSARRWSLDGWRGGLGGATFFDEFVDCRVVAGLLQSVDADAVLCVPPAAPLFDPALADRMIDHKIQMEQDFRLVFCQTPPGLSGLVLERTLIHELASANSPVGWAFSYQPDAPRRDLIFEACCLEVPREVRHAVGRLSVDCDRSAAMVAECLRANGDAEGVDVGRWLINRKSEQFDSLPLEVEIELTTEDPYPDALLRPRGSRVESRGAIDPAIVAHVVRTISQRDDALLVLGGFGDPLRHPSFPDILRSIRDGGNALNSVFGLAVRTTGVNLTPEIIRAMVECDVDVLEITLDAWSGELYSKLQNPGDPTKAPLEPVLAVIDKVTEVRSALGSIHPIVVPAFTKSRDNVHELDEFHDGWIRRLGTVMIGATSTHAGQFEDRRVIDMAPAARSACQRLSSRCVVLADGRVTPCDQDLNGQLSMGRLPDTALDEVWLGTRYAELRRTHQDGCTDGVSLCGKCSEWHRR